MKKKSASFLLGTTRACTQATRCSGPASDGRARGRRSAGTRDRPTGQSAGRQRRDRHGEAFPVERPAPAIMDRAAVSVPLQTGLKAVDALVPSVRGQRELILGDRQTGRLPSPSTPSSTSAGKMWCASIARVGQRAAAVAKVVANLDKQGAMDYTVVVVVEDNNAPASSTSRLMRRQHCRILHGKRTRCPDCPMTILPPCTRLSRAFAATSAPTRREAFPGDIFYIHSRMLERSTHLSKERGGGSLTALPIIETEAAGHIRLHPDQPDLHHRRAGLPFAHFVFNLGFSQR